MSIDPRSTDLLVQALTLMDPKTVYTANPEIEMSIVTTSTDAILAVLINLIAMALADVTRAGGQHG